MLTFMSRSLRRWLRPAPANEPAAAEFHNELNRLRSAWKRAELHAARSDTTVAFVAGEGARIYSLDAFRPRRDSNHPKAA